MIRSLFLLALTIGSLGLASAQEFSTPPGPTASADFTYTVNVVPATKQIQVTGLENFEFNVNVGADYELKQTINICVYITEDTPFSFLMEAPVLTDGTNDFAYWWTLYSAKAARARTNNVYPNIHPNGRTELIEGWSTYSTVVDCPDPNDMTQLSVELDDSYLDTPTSGATAKIIMTVVPD